MTKVMTPSKTMTTGQIDKAVANYRALLEKHSREFNSDAVQTVLSQPELTNEQLSVFRRRVEAVSNLIIRKIAVNRSLMPKRVLDATGRMQYTIQSVVDAMPKGDGEEVEVVFFKLNLSRRNNYISDDDLEKEFNLRGLVPADPYSVAAVNRSNPTFADAMPHATHWKDGQGNWCFATFFRWLGGREVSVRRSNDGWRDYWWFAGLRKSTKN